VATHSQRNLPTIGAVALYVAGLIACFAAYGLIRAGSCPISTTAYYVANTSLAVSAFGVVIAGLGAVILKSIGTGIAFGVGVLICGGIYVVLGALGAACSGI
jgi:hypothetical protein